MSALALTPWARERLRAVDVEALDDRAREMDVVVSAIHSRARWTVRVLRGANVVTTLRAVGPLAAIIAGALDDAEAAA